VHRRRWDGRPGRLEVWYATATDAATGTGLWVHHEVVAPTDGGPPYGHGWVVIFPPGATPVCQRFGPEPALTGLPANEDHVDFAVAGVSAAHDRFKGSAGRVAWDVAVAGGGAPLHTMGRWAWHRDLLPAAHVVTRPTARMTGRLRVGDEEMAVAGPGAVARIYGHGNAQRWAWLHADLGGGDVLEVVSAVSRRPGMRNLRPLPFVRLRVHGHDWPREPLLSAPLFTSAPALPDWHLHGVSGRHRLTVHVRLDPAESVALDYADPDGAPAVCTNSERASADVLLERWSGSWQTSRRWRLDRTAHAEVGLRES